MHLEAKAYYLMTQVIQLQTLRLCAFVVQRYQGCGGMGDISPRASFAW